MRCVYTLSDPRTGAIRYVGQAKDPKRRYTAHCSRSGNRYNNRRCNWLRLLIDLGLKPDMQILESEVDDLNAAEMRWIKHFKDLGCDLTNGNDGGIDTSHIYGPRNDNIWCGLHTPLQEVRMTIQWCIRSMRRINDSERAEKFTRYLKTLDDRLKPVIKKMGIDWINIEIVKRNPDRYPRHLEALEKWAFSDV